MRILVTGGAGFIGTALVRSLVADSDNEVRILDDLSTQGESLIPPRSTAEFYLGDVLDPGDWFRATRAGVDVVYHLAAIASVQKSIEDPLRVARVNAEGALRAVQWARETGARRVVLSSSSAVYAPGWERKISESDPTIPLSPYGASKLAAEHFALTTGEAFEVEVAVLRLFNVYGPGQSPDGEYAAVVPRFIRDVLDGRSPTIYGDGSAVRDFVFIGDVVRAFLEAGHNPSAAGGVFNIGTGRGTSVLELASIVRDVAGSDVGVKYADARPGELRASVADPHLAFMRLGWTHRVGLVDGVRTTLQAMRS